MEYELSEKQTTIEDLMAKLDWLTEELHAINLINQQQTEELKKNGDSIEYLTALNHKQTAYLEKHDHMLNFINENVLEFIAALQNVSDNSFLKEFIQDHKTKQLVVVYTGEEDNYDVILAQKNYVRRKINSLVRSNPATRVIIKFTNHPNVHKLWMACSKILVNESEIQVRGTKFTMPLEKEDWLIDQLNTLNDENYDDRTKEAVRSASDLMSMKMEDLKNICRENGMKGWSKFRKVDLINFICEESK